MPGAATGTAEVTVNEPPPFADVDNTFDEDATERETADAGDWVVTTPTNVAQTEIRAIRRKTLAQYIPQI